MTLAVLLQKEILVNWVIFSSDCDSWKGQNVTQLFVSSEWKSQETQQFGAGWMGGVGVGYVDRCITSAHSQDTISVNQDQCNVINHCTLTPPYTPPAILILTQYVMTLCNWNGMGRLPQCISPPPPPETGKLGANTICYCTVEKTTHNQCYLFGDVENTTG